MFDAFEYIFMFSFNISGQIQLAPFEKQLEIRQTGGAKG